MQFYSTRANHTQNRALVGIDDALNAGLAPDGGLFIPEHIPKLGDLSHLPLTLPSIAAHALAPFFTDSVLRDELPNICAASLNLPMPVVSLSNNASVLELFHGPTAAFKDFAARFLAACMAKLRIGKPKATVLVATSGDTGGAVAAAFHNLPGFDVVILYPDGRVSPRQAHQLGAFGGNVHAYRVAGTFDDCQAMVKASFSDASLRTELDLLSANSISLGRLLPQMAYYVYASERHRRESAQCLNLVIPTGNLGHGLGAILARAMGAPIGDIVLACNANRPLADVFATGLYAPKPSIATLANAMDVGAPSNFERLQVMFPDQLMPGNPTRAFSVSDERISDVIRRTDMVVCPHTACAIAVLEQLRAAGCDKTWCIAATAHASKFDQIVEPLIGRKIDLPKGFAELLDKPAFAKPLGANAEELAGLLRELAKN